MVFCSLSCILLLIGAWSAVVLAQDVTLHTDTKTAGILEFVKSLEVSVEIAEKITTKLETDPVITTFLKNRDLNSSIPTKLASLSCWVALTTLGESSVTFPTTPALVEVNW